MPEQAANTPAERNRLFEHDGERFLIRPICPGDLRAHDEIDEGQRAGRIVVERLLDAQGNVVHAAVPAQNLEVRRASDPAPALVVREAPASVTREAVQVMNGPVEIRGELWVPRDAHGKIPVALQQSLGKQNTGDEHICDVGFAARFPRVVMLVADRLAHDSFKSPLDHHGPPDGRMTSHCIRR